MLENCSERRDLNSGRLAPHSSDLPFNVATRKLTQLEAAAALEFLRLFAVRHS
jgi:hypothetical protein